MSLHSPFIHPVYLVRPVTMGIWQHYGFPHYARYMHAHAIRDIQLAEARRNQLGQKK